MRSRELAQQGVEAMHREQWDSAQQRLAQAIKACPHDYHARSQYAEVMWQQGETQLAQEQLETAVELSGGDAQLLVRLGQLHLAQGNLSEADTYSQRAIASGTNLAKAWSLRGEVLTRGGRYDEALTCYLRAAGSEPCDLGIQLAIAEVYRHQGRPHRALSTLQAMRERWPAQQEPQQVLLLEGLALQALDRPHDAVDVLTLAASRGPANPEVYFRLGEAALLAGNPAVAQEAARVTLQLAPGHEGAMNVLQHSGGSEPRVATAAAP